MKFTKMQGIGNDYVYVNCFEETVSDPGRAARLISDRHFGIGSDGLILIKPSEIADFWMDMYNADGSSSGMCGNGIRCVAKYVYDHGMTDKTELTIESGGAIKQLKLTVKDGKVTLVTVDMGAPALTSNGKYLDLSGARRSELMQDEIWEQITVDGQTWDMICIDVGNPHAIVFVEDTDTFPVEQVGPLFENHPRFPQRTNVEFVQVISPSELKMRVWERGAGETLACGTGATATLAAAALAGRAQDKAQIQLLGGPLTIQWDKTTGHLWMTGEAAEVFQGEIAL